VHANCTLVRAVAVIPMQSRGLCRRLKCEHEDGGPLMNDNACLAGTEVRRPLHVSLLSAFDEIAGTVLKTARAKVHIPLQSYLDGRVLIGDAYVSRRGILLAIHDMKEDLEAPPALQERTLAEVESLKVQPAPELKLYRDIATALLRMEVVVRFQAVRNGDTKH
jgi:hypothetical protein